MGRSPFPLQLRTIASRRHPGRFVPPLALPAARAAWQSGRLRRRDLHALAGDAITGQRRRRGGAEEVMRNRRAKKRSTRQALRYAGPVGDGKDAASARASGEEEIMSGAAAETCELSNVMTHTMTAGQEGSKVIAPIRMVGDGWHALPYDPTL